MRGWAEIPGSAGQLSVETLCSCYLNWTQGIHRVKQDVRDKTLVITVSDAPPANWGVAEWDGAPRLNGIEDANLRGPRLKWKVHVAPRWIHLMEPVRRMTIEKAVDFFAALNKLAGKEPEKPIADEFQYKTVARWGTVVSDSLNKELFGILTSKITS